MKKLHKGYIHVYTGDGKGKTTAAIGLAVRALSRGFNVCLVQFLKGDTDSGECALLKKSFNNISITSTGTKNFVTGAPSEEDISEAGRGLAEVKKAIASQKYDLIILDEINSAIDLKIIGLDEILKIIKNKPDNVELVLTGRNAKKEIIELADLVTEMREIKHYYGNGVTARLGIEK